MFLYSCLSLFQVNSMFVCCCLFFFFSVKFNFVRNRFLALFNSLQENIIFTQGICNSLSKRPIILYFYLEYHWFLLEHLGQNNLPSKN